MRVTINGIELITEGSKTILEVVNEHKIDTIPTLCHDDRLEPFGSCFLCVVEVKGLNRLVPACSTPVSDGMEITTRNEWIDSSRKTALELLLSNHYADCIGPCIDNCPAKVDAQGYIALISQSKHEEALKLIKQTNPLPLSIGRVCVRNCEDVCRRCYVDDPVAINFLKRFVADRDYQDMWKPEIMEKTGKKVAIIGGGPAGLTTAYYLSLEGHSCTIMEKLPKLGGMMRYGIPSYRLPREVLDAEIKSITNLGVEVKTGVALGRDFTLEDLKAEGYDAVFIGVGAHKASIMRLEREDEIRGIYGGIDFLRSIEIDGASQINGKVIVIGGGNTAIDAARTSLRLGAEKVTIVYRRSINEMPAHPAEIEAAQEEGIDIQFLTNPKSLRDENGKIDGIECLKMRLEKVKGNGRPKPVPIEGSEFFIPCDHLIGAIGQQIDREFAQQGGMCELSKWNEPVINPETMETSLPGVFAGGDVVTGPLTAVSAIGQGKKAAWSISQYLLNGSAKGEPKKFLSFKHKLAPVFEREFEQFGELKREKMPELSAKIRTDNFNEVELGFESFQVCNEASRCLECGCSEYYDCELRHYADEFQIDIEKYIGEVRKFKVDDSHPFIVLDPNKCINCGKCVRTCADILKVSALGFVNRGFKAVVKPFMEKSLLDSNCISCGCCIDVCPTGAISEKFPFKVLGTLEKRNFQTICNFCSLGCAINYKVIDEDLFYISNTVDSVKHGVNNGYLCVKGRFGHRYLNGNHQIQKPMIREMGKIRETDIDQALEYAYQKVSAIMEKYGSNSVAVFASPKMSNEELYLLQKFTRTGLQNNNISSFSNMMYDSEVGALDNLMGVTVSNLTVDSISEADVIVVINSNISEENMIMELRIKQAQKSGAELILINSAEIGLVKYADLWIDAKKGTNTILLNGLLNAICNQTEENDQELIALVKDFDPELVSDFTGVDRQKVDSFIKLLSQKYKNVVFVYNLDSIKEKSANDLQAIGNYLSLTNRINREHNGLILLREYANSTGLTDMGCHPDYLPGYVKADEKEEIQRIAQTWNSDLKGIFKSTDIKQRLLDKQIKAILIFGEDPLLNDDNQKYFKGVEFILAFDLFSSETVAKADVVLPAKAHLFQNGTYTSCDTKIQKIEPMFEAQEELQNWEIILKFAKKFSLGFDFHSSKEIFAEIKKVNRVYQSVQLNDHWNQSSLNQNLVSHRNASKYLQYKIDITPFDPEKPSIHYSDYFYREKIKKLLRYPVNETADKI